MATSATHARSLLQALLVPPPASRNGEELRAEMVEMGFPRREKAAASCLGYDGGSSALTYLEESFVCPRCETRAAEVPSVCNICTLPLVSASTLAQSYHHLFPLPPFEPEPRREPDDSGGRESSGPCFGCGFVLVDGMDEGSDVFVCPDCKMRFCEECEAFLHETLHSCPGCTTK